MTFIEDVDDFFQTGTEKDFTERMNIVVKVGLDVLHQFLPITLEEEVKQFIFVLEIIIERVFGNHGAVCDVLDGEFVEIFLLKQFFQCIC